ncbi:MAG: phospholipase domain-containing protein, partial [Planctomycetaceae bacterium]
PGGRLEDSWPIAGFHDRKYHLRAYGPNGFFREFIGNETDPSLDLELEYAKSPDGKSLSGSIEIVAVNRDSTQRVTVEVHDNAYGNAVASQVVAPGKRATIVVDTEKSAGWYDVTLRVVGSSIFEKRYAGHLETGKWTTSDPAMGRVTT